jgi:hypothetical protein
MTDTVSIVDVQDLTVDFHGGAKPLRAVAGRMPTHCRPFVHLVIRIGECVPDDRMIVACQLFRPAALFHGAGQFGKINAPSAFRDS